MDTRIEPRRAAWRMLGLGKNRRDRTVVHLHFENGGSGQGYASQLYRRKPELKGKDKPKAETVSA